MLESTRAKEDAVKKETTEQLDLFRRQQEEADKALREENDGKEVEEAGSPTTGEAQWAVPGRKRKRVKEKEGLKGLKLRKSSSTQDSVALVARKKDESEDSPEANTRESLVDANKKEEIGKGPATLASASNTTPTVVKEPSMPEKASSSSQKSLPGLGLAGYSSDEDN